MTIKERKEQVRSYLGKTVTVKIDRPVGYVHNKESYTITYPINYGYLPNVIGGDGEELDVYLLGVSEPVKEYRARVIGIVHRENDVEDKLVAAPLGMVFSKEQVEKAVDFQERYYDTHIEMCNITAYECIAHKCEFENLPADIMNMCVGKISVFLGDGEFRLYTNEEYDELLESVKRSATGKSVMHVICEHAEIVTDERSLFLAIFHACKHQYSSLSDDAVIYVKFLVIDGRIEMIVQRIDEKQ
ncbi:MAG: inorganic diphosphatase [Monoglobaceae bacterium]